ncbi:MAG TPA: signal recognition particle-docking protein FtsY [Candidatus Aminicenantes bacterium]|nr:signal recognition particle-docking protein FtsY [Candidatus Aminicenantes bacterium]
MKLRRLFTAPLSEALRGVIHSSRDRESTLEELEETLILADVSAPLTETLLRAAEKRTGYPFDADEFIRALRRELTGLLDTKAPALGLPPGKQVILLVGVNGCGKTTTAAKIGLFWRARGRKVLLAAADTFRAAGSSQLSLWGERLNMPVVGGERGADPGSVVHNSLTSLVNRDFDLLVVDTAGRVQTRTGLMQELGKLTRIVRGFLPHQPRHVWLVVDATMGQNTLDQARRFREFSGITGIVLTKLDGTARGGAVLNILNEIKLPVVFAGTGEKAEDLEPFSVNDFIDSLLPL